MNRAFCPYSVHFGHICAHLLKAFGYGHPRQNGKVPQEIEWGSVGGLNKLESWTNVI